MAKQTQIEQVAPPAIVDAAAARAAAWNDYEATMAPARQAFKAVWKPARAVLDKKLNAIRKAAP